jgi:hypothetical protein
MYLNQVDNLYGISIDYMDCNSEAFENGDVVVVKFQDNNWGKGQVVGFKSKPKPCVLKEYVMVRFHTKAFIWDVQANDYYLEIDDWAAVLLLLASDFTIADPNPNYTGIPPWGDPDPGTWGSVLRNLPLYNDWYETIFSKEDRETIGLISYWDLQYTYGPTKYPNLASGESYFLSAPEYTQVGWRSFATDEYYYDETAFSTGLYGSQFWPAPLGELGTPPSPSPYEYSREGISGDETSQVFLGESPEYWYHWGAFAYPYDIGGINGTEARSEVPGSIYTIEAKTMVQISYQQEVIWTRDDPLDPIAISNREDRVLAACGTYPFTLPGPVESSDPLLQPRNTEFETACALLFDTINIEVGLAANELLPWIPEFGWGEGTKYYGQPAYQVEIFRKN